MILSESAKKFDGAYHQVIQFLQQQDRPQFLLAYESWLTYRYVLEENLTAVIKAGNLDLIFALDTYLDASFVSLDSDSGTLASQYPDYVEAKEALFNMLYPAALIAPLIAADASVSIREQAVPVVHARSGVKQFLQGWLKP
jgi:hypothetical protein